MRTVDIPSSEGLIVDDENNDMSIVLCSTVSARTFTIELDEYSLPTTKESQEKDVVNEPNLSFFSQDPLQDDSTPKDTNEDITTETEPECIRLTAQMVVDGIAEIIFLTSSHSEYLQNFQEYLECMEENMCVLNEKTEARVKTLQVTIEYFEGTTAYIKGQVARNMRRIQTLDQKIHNTIEACLSLMNQKIDDFIQFLSNLESIYEAKLDHMQNHVTAHDRYISTLEKSIAELSKASASSSTSPFQAFSEQKTVQLLVDEVKAIKKQSSSSDLCALQKKVASTDSKLDLILAKLSGSNERSPEPEGEKVHKNRSSQSPIIHQIPDSPNEFEKRRYEKIQSLDKIIVDARLKAQLTEPWKVEDYLQVLKELAKETQMEIDEELAKQLKAKELKSKQEMFRKKNSPEISTKERSTWHDKQFRVSSPKTTIFFNPVRDSYQKLGEKEAEEPNVNLNMLNELPGNILKKPHRRVVFSSKGRLFMRISQKQLFFSEFIEDIIGLLKRIGDPEESLR
ncbi:unnamed protein product [Lactuca saligna]|uniref:Uncharacterized protein n=1 Tax=Lactuca saligna TaxID=75948 RepID=A0AA35USN7_LACSI|nr:unnamed protein product [Lactuca saligna]CAI9303204.1 unnamed protein product [Lactuca saligna]